MTKFRSKLGSEWFPANNLFSKIPEKLMFLLRNKLAFSVFKWLRHHPAISRYEWFWIKARNLYNFLLDPFGRGIKVQLGRGPATARIPRHLAAFPWETFEIENLQATLDFIAKNQNTCVLDIGSSIGAYAVQCLAASPDCHVIAFDSDTASLNELMHTSKFENPKRVTRILGLVGSENVSKLNFESAVASSKSRIDELKNSKDKSTPQYVCFEGPSSTVSNTPTHSIDGLVMESTNFRTLVKDRKILVKIDVEGAEYMVLKGAEAFFKEFQPAVAISIHWYWLSKFNTSYEEIHGFFASMGYEGFRIAKDHEDHWWYEVPKKKVA